MSTPTYQPGSKLKSLPVTLLNALVSEADKPDRRAREPWGGDSLLVRVRNDSGVAVPANGVLGIADVITPDATDPAFRVSLPVLSGVTPAANHAGKFVVLRNALPSGDVGLAWIQGVFPVMIDVTDEAHGAADVKPGDTTQLASGASGTATILWKESGVGTKWALVRLTGGGGGESGTYETPHNLTFAGEHSEAARTNTYVDDDGDTVHWSRVSPPAGTVGLKVTIQAGEAYYDAGNEHPTTKATNPRWLCSARPVRKNLDTTAGRDGLLRLVPNRPSR